MSVSSTEASLPSQHTPEDPYVLLRKKVEALGLFKKQPLYNLSYGILLAIGFATSLYILTISTNIIVQTLNALLLSIVSIQLGYLGHDIAHHQVFESDTTGRWVGSSVYALFLGISLEHWYGGHNDHHKYTNQHGKDPDIELPLVFSEIQLKDRGVAYKKYILPHQHWYFFLFMPLAYLNYIIVGIPWNPRKLLQPLRVHEFVLTIIHFVIFSWILFYSLGFWLSMYFLVVFAMTTGAYAGFSFAPNHKGQEVLAPETAVTYKTQITSTRNIFSGPFTDLAMGGLNYQIEHHLFSNLPRRNLKKVQTLVKAFCREQHIPYHEISFVDSVLEMYRSLRHFATQKVA